MASPGPGVVRAELRRGHVREDISLATKTTMSPCSRRFHGLVCAGTSSRSPSPLSRLRSPPSLRRCGTDDDDGLLQHDLGIVDGASSPIVPGRVAYPISPVVSAVWSSASPPLPTTATGLPSLSEAGPTALPSRAPSSPAVSSSRESPPAEFEFPRAASTVLPAPPAASGATWPPAPPRHSPFPVRLCLGRTGIAAE